MLNQGPPCLLAAAMILGSTHAFAPANQAPRRLAAAWPRAVHDADSRSAVATTDCLVVGGGLSGCALAHNLNRAGVDVLLAEARDAVGGNVRTRSNANGYLWEEGPNSFSTTNDIVRLCHELGLDGELVFADPALPPWIYHDKALHPLPKGKGGTGGQGQRELLFGANGLIKFFLTGSLLSWRGKLRAVAGAFLGHAPPPHGREETVREWVSRTLGPEVFERCIDPFVSGVYAGDPDTLGMAAALSKVRRVEDNAYKVGWNRRGAIFFGGLARQVELAKERRAEPLDPQWPPFRPGNPGSFRRGLATLPNAIAASLGLRCHGSGGAASEGADEGAVSDGAAADGGEACRVRLRWNLTSLEHRPAPTPREATSEASGEARDVGGPFVATFATPGGARTVLARSVVSTVPLHALRGVLPDLLPAVDEACAAERANVNRTGLYYSPVASVAFAYPTSSLLDVALPNGFGRLPCLPGFGSLNPRASGVRTLGTLWTSSLFPGRAPAGHHQLISFLGGSRDPAVADLTDAEMVAEVDKDLRGVLIKPEAPPPLVLGVKLWAAAIPQPELGHAQLLARLAEAEAQVPGLWVCGNFRSGVSIPDCVAFGRSQAKVVADFLVNDKGL